MPDDDKTKKYTLSQECLNESKFKSVQKCSNNKNSNA